MIIFKKLVQRGFSIEVSSIVELSDSLAKEFVDSPKVYFFSGVVAYSVLVGFKEFFFLIAVITTMNV